MNGWTCRKVCLAPRVAVPFLFVTFSLGKQRKSKSYTQKKFLDMLIKIKEASTADASSIIACFNVPVERRQPAINGADVDIFAATVDVTFKLAFHSLQRVVD